MAASAGSIVIFESCNMGGCRFSNRYHEEFFVYLNLLIFNVSVHICGVRLFRPLYNIKLAHAWPQISSILRLCPQITNQRGSLTHATLLLLYSIAWIRFYKVAYSVKRMGHPCNTAEVNRFLVCTSMAEKDTAPGERNRDEWEAGKLAQYTEIYIEVTKHYWIWYCSV